MTTTQQQILDRLSQLLRLSPEMRFGQLVSNLACLGRPDDLEPTPVIDDQEFLTACDEHLHNLERRAALRTADLQHQPLTETTP